MKNIILATAGALVFILTGWISYSAGQSDVIADLGVKRDVYYEAKARCESFEEGPCVVVGARGFVPKSALQAKPKGLEL